MSTAKVMVLTDPSEYRPEKKAEDFRDFNIHSTPSRVVNTYRLMHTHQTLGFVRRQEARWGKLDHAQLSIMEALDALNGLVDESDPDVDMPNSFHAFQTAEGIRQKHPDKPWLQLTGLIHDLGKMLALWGEPQWCVVGDTFPVGCAPDPAIVFGVESFHDNPDLQDPKLNSRLGIYQESCGLDSVHMSWGHDEYLYRVLKGNECHLPEEALFIVRFHSFYPWHTSGAYRQLCSNKDLQMLQWVNEFNKFDLYTKSDQVPDVQALRPYYQGLIDQFLPGKLNW